MNNQSILWADDEIDLLKPHIMFLNKKGYDVTPVNSGTDALDHVQESHFDVVFLDENMPGMTGLETLDQIKEIRPNVPVVMITKSEEEYIMEEAIGAKIADYLLKPINPNQILLSLKKIFESSRLVTEKTNSSYQQDFRKISMAFSENLTWEEWVDIYKKLVFWDLEIDQTEAKSMSEVLDMQKTEANVNFAKFIKENYADWIAGDEDAPLLSHNLMREKVLPIAKKKERPMFFILVDNLRYDQWKMIEGEVSKLFKAEKSSTYYSILPTTTAYARNAIFSGMMPSDMAKYHSDIWKHDDDEGSKNASEDVFFERQLKNARLDLRFSYHKIIHSHQGKQVLDGLNNMLNNNINLLVYNFVDMLSHARTDTEMVRELAPDDSAYRSLTLSWFNHSSLMDALRFLASKDVDVIITTDHGTKRTMRPHKIIGDRNTNTNLRYKQGKSLSYDKKNVLSCLKPETFKLPKVNVSTTYAFATEDYFFAYPNNYNHYVKYYKDTFQHGGVSLEEMIIPFIHLTPKS